MLTRTVRLTSTIRPLFPLPLFLLCALLFVNCSGGGGGSGAVDLPDLDTAEAQAEAAEVTVSLAETELEHERLLAEETADGARAALITWLEARQEVADAGECDGGGSVWIRYTNGVRVTYVTEAPTGDLDARTSGAPAASPRAVAALPPMTLLGQSNWATLYLPYWFETSDFCTEAGWGSAAACQDWQNFPRPDEDFIMGKFMAGFYAHPDLPTIPTQAIALVDQAATVEFLAGFLAAHAYDPQHLYINTHGGVSDGVMDMNTGEIASLSAPHFRDYWEAAKDGEMTWHRKNGNTYWGVTPAFVRRYLGQRAADSAPLHVHNAACYGWHSSMRNAFMESGAASYSGYDGVAKNGFIRTTTESYIKALSTGLSVNDAHGRVVPDTDEIYGTGTRFHVTAKSDETRWFYQVSTYLDGQVDDRLVTPTSESFAAVDDPDGGVRLFSSLVNKPALPGEPPEGGIVGELSLIIPAAATGPHTIDSSALTAIYFSPRSGGLTYGATQELKEENSTCRGTIRIETFQDTAGGLVEGSFEGMLINEQNITDTRSIGGSFSALRSK